HVFGTRLETIPAQVPYLDLAALRRRKDSCASLPASDLAHVGIVWARSATHANDRQRSCAAHDFLPVLRTPGSRSTACGPGSGARGTRPFSSTTWIFSSPSTRPWRISPARSARRCGRCSARTGSGPPGGDDALPPDPRRGLGGRDGARGGRALRVGEAAA